MKKSSLIIFIAIAIIGILSYILCIQFTKNKKYKDRVASLEMILSEDITQRFEPIKDTVVQTIVNEKDTIVYKYKIIDRKKHFSISESTINKSYLDSIKNALDVAEDEITRITRLNSEMDKKLTKANLINDKLKRENVYTWKDENSEVVANLNDSTASVKYNAKITITDFSKKPNFFSGREFFTAVSTDDENLKINGLQTYEHKVNVKCPSVHLGIQGGYGAVYTQEQVRLAPYIGLGLNFEIF